MKTQKLTFIALTCFVLAACSKETPTENSTVEKVAEVAAPSNLISLKEAKIQLDNYNEAHKAEVGSEYGLRTWISLEDLKAYIAYIEEESKAKGIEVSGIDMIHTQYKQGKPGSPNADNSVYDKTLMLAPTYQNGDEQVAFDPIYSENGKPKALKELLDSIKKDSLFGQNQSKPAASSIANNLNSCPNMCK